MLLRHASWIIALGGLSALAQPAGQAVPQLRNVGVVQKLNAQVPLDLVFTKETGEKVTMRQLLTGKPVILSLVYYGCPRLCNMTLTGLLKTMRAIPLTAGNDFDVVTVSFDPRETPALAQAKKHSYLEGYGRAAGARGWHFLTGSQMDIERLTKAVGFGFEYDPKLDQFAHASAIMVLTPTGRVSKYFYGIDFPPRDVRLGLVDASERKIGTRVDQFLLYCFHYDPTTGRYSMAIMNALRSFGIVTLLAIVAFIFLAIRRYRPQGVMS